MTRQHRSRWSDQDRQHFADRNILRARTVPSKRTPPPTIDEWNDDDHSDPQQGLDPR